MVYYYRLSIMGAEHKVYPVKCLKPINLDVHPRLEGKDVAVCEIAQDTYKRMMENYTTDLFV